MLQLTISANDIRLNDQVLPATINEAPSHAAYTGKSHCTFGFHLFEHLYNIASSTIA